LRNDSYKDPPTITPAPKRHGGGGFQSYSLGDEQPNCGSRRGATRKESGEEERKGKGRANARGSDYEDDDDDDDDD
jgi:hypothetical protein